MAHRPNIKADTNPPPPTSQASRALPAQATRAPQVYKEPPAQATSPEPTNQAPTNPEPIKLSQAASPPPTLSQVLRDSSRATLATGQGRPKGDNRADNRVGNRADSREDRVLPSLETITPDIEDPVETDFTLIYS